MEPTETEVCDCPDIAVCACFDDPLGGDGEDD